MEVQSAADDAMAVLIGAALLATGMSAGAEFSLKGAAVVFNASRGMEAAGEASVGEVT